MKKYDNLIHSVFVALLCASVLFFTACGDDGDDNGGNNLVLPVIAGVPANQTLEVGESLILTILMSDGNTSAYTYQWYKDGVAITDVNAGSDKYEYTKSSVAESDAGSYTCKVSNTAGSVTSTPIIVTVTKKDIIDNTPNVLTSTSFEVVGGITDSVSGYYQDHGNQTKGIYGAFTIKNKSRYSLNYYVIVEKIAMPDNHMAGICIGECAYIFGKDLPETRNFPPTGGIELKAGATTNSKVDSYIKLSAGNDDHSIEPIAATPGQTMLRVTYVNTADETDFVRFKLYWNFTADK